MSQENLELFRRGVEAWNAGDMEALAELYDPAVVMYHLEGWPEPGPSVGRDAVMREWEQIAEPFPEGIRIEILELVDAGNNVVASYAWRGSGRGPDAAMEMSMVLTVRKGKVITIQNFWDHDEALAAAGVRE
jgi:uncharacterized protein